MKTSLEKTLDFTLKSEGGYQCNRADPGNWTGGRVGVGELVGTKYGLSAPLMLGGAPYQTASLTAKQVKLFSKDDFRRVATDSFWTPLLCNDLPIGLDLLVFDHGFNAGLKPSIRLLQHIAEVPDDGINGPTTLQAVAAASPVKLIPYLNHEAIILLQRAMLVDETGALDTAMRDRLNRPQWRDALWVAALASMQAVDYRNKRNFSVFGRGWLNRVQARAVAALELCREVRLQTDKPALSA